jgi:hypothetical protein
VLRLSPPFGLLVLSSSVGGLSHALSFVSNNISVRASIVTAYDSGHTYEVTAGVGQFNGSYVPRYLEKIKAVEPSYRYQVVPSTILAASYSLVWNSLHVINGAPIECASCDAYLLTGGVILTTPFIPEGYDKYPLVNIDNAPATQVQFERGMAKADGFQDENCSVYGGSGNITLGMKVCINKSKAAEGSYVAGESTAKVCRSLADLIQDCTSAKTEQQIMHALNLAHSPT